MPYINDFAHKKKRKIVPISLEGGEKVKQKTILRK